VAVRVLWVVKGLGPGGAEHLLVAAARAHDPERVHLECAYVVPWKDHLVGELEAAGVRTHCLSLRRRDRLWPQRLAGLVRGGRWDVVHVHSPLPGSIARVAARAMPPSRRPRIVSTEHNRWETHRVPTRSLNKVSSRFDDAAFAVTDEVKASMRGRVAEVAITVRHGIDVASTAATRAERADVRAELGIAEEEIVVGTVANFRQQKDYPTLLRAARLLADRGVAVRFVAVGQGPQEDQVRQLAAQLELGDRVILTGFRSDAVRVMAACDIFTLASQWEGLPVALMEALALGLPIVATAVGGVAEEMHDGEDALLVPPRDPAALADAIERVVTDSDLRTRLGAAAAARADEFDVARTARLLEDTYERLAASRPPRPVEVEEKPGASKPGGSARSGPRPAPLEIRHASADDRAEILALLRRSLGGDEGDHRYPALFAWKHDENYFGQSPMWVATDGDRIVAFRTFMRWEFERGGRVLRAVRAVDTATDPEYQGRGLFRALTLEALDEVRGEGVDFVFNTPNSQSRPGYLKMGWREVGRLPAAVRFVGPTGAAVALRSKVPAERWSQPLKIGEDVGTWLDAGGPGDRLAPPADVRELRTRVDQGFLRWRFTTPLLQYRVVDDGDAAVFVRARRRGRALELAVVAQFGDPFHCDRVAVLAAKHAGANYAIRIGQPQISAGFAPLPGGGPVLTWRAVNDAGLPPLANWALTLGDVELF
jgi:glycosyltransferase involved in cell wall biosynthesis/GNAT superfamily N-acetyltransferase